MTKKKKKTKDQIWVEQKMIWRVSSGSNICLENSSLIIWTNEIRYSALIYLFYVNLDSFRRG